MPPKRGLISVPRTAQEPERPPVVAEQKNQKQLMVWIPAMAHKQLREMVVENDMTIQAIVREALNDYFTKHNRPPIA